MQLVGMLDSPFVRRVAIALVSAGIAFEHRPISVFRHIDAFTALSPLVKAPSLILDDGTAIVDSGIILEYLAVRFPALTALSPKTPAAYAALGAALVVMEKAVQIHYERALRGEGERSESWRQRIGRQLDVGLAALEASAPSAFYEARLTHADIAAACAFAFVRHMVGDVVDTAPYARLAAFAARAEALPAFRSAPVRDGAKVEVVR